MQLQKVDADLLQSADELPMVAAPQAIDFLCDVLQIDVEVGALRPQPTQLRRLLLRPAVEVGLVARRHHPTLPSSEIPSSFCASTANSIGSCCSTSFAKPLTISATESSAFNPRLMA